MIGLTRTRTRIHTRTAHPDSENPRLWAHVWTLWSTIGRLSMGCLKTFTALRVRSTFYKLPHTSSPLSLLLSTPFYISTSSYLNHGSSHFVVDCPGVLRKRRLRRLGTLMPRALCFCIECGVSIELQLILFCERDV